LRENAAMSSLPVNLDFPSLGIPASLEDWRRVPATQQQKATY
jgi:hypothetical protein